MIFELTMMGLLAYANPQPALEASHRPQLSERTVIEHPKLTWDPTKPPTGKPNAIFKVIHEGQSCGYIPWSLTGNPCWEDTNIVIPKAE